MLTLPPHEICNLVTTQTSGVESGRGCAAQIVKVQVAIGQLGSVLGAIEGRSESVYGPRPLPLISQNGRGVSRYPPENLAQSGIERHYRFASVTALAGRDDDRIVTHMRPRQ